MLPLDSNVEALLMEIITGRRTFLHPPTDNRDGLVLGRRIWHSNRKGRLSVRSAYLLATASNEGPSSSSPGVREEDGSSNGRRKCGRKFSYSPGGAPRTRYQ
ncbi:hypothetical protein Salat_0834000 [Sesamum alatum]|uniref:Uncharacterized protein n=1 Tax=Sesamum alatum TaxID=300844 RepID=A0AAE1YJL8_9LAMI|nr:hypothetical protein Salat_0834000 [Sesamum alatum]